MAPYTAPTLFTMIFPLARVDDGNYLENDYIVTQAIERMKYKVHIRDKFGTYWLVGLL